PSYRGCRYRFPPPPAPGHWAAASPCEPSVRCPSSAWPSTFQSPDHKVPLSSRCHCYPLPPPPEPCHRAAASPWVCDVRCSCGRSPPTSHCPDRPPPRPPILDSCYRFPPPPEPCHWSAASQCERRVRSRDCRWEPNSDRRLGFAAFDPPR